MSKDGQEVRGRAKRISGERTFQVEGTARVKAPRWEFSCWGGGTARTQCGRAEYATEEAGGEAVRGPRWGQTGRIQRQGLVNTEVFYSERSVKLLEGLGHRV